MLQSPNSLYSSGREEDLIRDLGVDLKKFETAFERDFYPSLYGLSRGTFFNREAFGRDVLVTGDPGGDGDEPPRNAKPLKEFVAGFPISDAGKAQIDALYPAPTTCSLLENPPLKSAPSSSAPAGRDYLTRIWG